MRVTPTRRERKLATQVLQAMSGFESIGEDLGAIREGCKHPGVVARAGAQLAGELEAAMRRCLEELDLGTDVDGDPDPFTQMEEEP